MSDRAGLTRAMVESPDDDAPRLVMADWFDDHGEAERAEFIRVQCQIARLDPTDRERLVPLAARERELLEEHHATWCQEFPGWARKKITFRRGFGSALRATQVQWVKSRTLARSTPIEALSLERHDAPRLATIASGPHLDSIRVLRPGLGHPLTTAVTSLEVLGRSPYLSRLRVLDLYRGGCSVGSTRGDSLARALGAMTNLPNLESLSLGYCEIGANGIGDLMRSPHFGRLKALDLYSDPIGDAGARHLAGSPSASSLTALDLAQTGITDAGVEALADSPHLARLTHLNLRCEGLTQDSAQAVARSDHLTRLESLSFHFGSVGHGGALELAESANLANLVYLNLFGNQIGDGGARLLADSPFLTRLRVLELGRNDLTRKGLEALARSKAFPNLEQISLYATADAAAMADELKTRLPRLRVVGFYPIVFDSIARRDCEEAFAPLHGGCLLQRIE